MSTIVLLTKSDQSGKLFTGFDHDVETCLLPSCQPYYRVFEKKKEKKAGGGGGGFLLCVSISLVYMLFSITVYFSIQLFSIFPFG